MDPRKKVRVLIDQLDERIAAQVGVILDHPEFQLLQRAWRGLFDLVRRTETGEAIQIQFVSVTKEELREDLAEFRGEHWDKSALFRELHGMKYGGFGGEPYGLLILDYDLGDGAADAGFADDLDQVAEIAHTVVLVGDDSETGSDRADMVVRLHPPTQSGVASAHSLAWRIGDAFARTGWFPEPGKYISAGPPGLSSFLAVNRFAQYLKCLYRDTMGRYANREAVEAALADWLASYVADGPTTAERPLAAASLAVEYDLDDSERYRFRLCFRAGHGIDEGEERIVAGRLGY